MHTQYNLTLFQCYREHLEHNCTTWKLTCYEKNTQKSFQNKSVNTFMLPIAMINPIKQPGFVLQTVTKGVNAVSVAGNISSLSKKSQFQIVWGSWFYSQGSLERTNSQTKTLEAQLTDIPSMLALHCLTLPLPSPSTIFCLCYLRPSRSPLASNTEKVLQIHMPCPTQYQSDVLLPMHWKYTAENDWGGIISAWNWRISFLQMPIGAQEECCLWTGKDMVFCSMREQETLTEEHLLLKNIKQSTVRFPLATC